MKFLKILTLSIISFLAAQSTLLAGHLKFSSPYPEIVLSSCGITARNVDTTASRFACDQPPHVIWKSKDTDKRNLLFYLDQCFNGDDELHIREASLKFEGTPESTLILIVSMLEKKCVADKPCLFPDHQIDEFVFTIIKAYFNDVELVRDNITNPVEAFFEGYHSAYLQHHPKQYYDAVVESVKYYRTVIKKEEL